MGCDPVGPRGTGARTRRRLGPAPGRRREPRRPGWLAGAAMLALACGDGGTGPPPDPVPATVVVSPAAAQAASLGETVQLSAVVLDRQGTAMAGAGVTWASSAPSVATVGETGLVTAVGNGSAVVTATFGWISGSATVTVAQAPASVAVTPPASTVEAGATVRLAAQAFDANGHPAPASFVWRSADTTLARVDAYGLVTGVGHGTASITASVGDVGASAEITVENPDAAALAALYEATGGRTGGTAPTG